MVPKSIFTYSICSLLCMFIEYGRVQTQLDASHGKVWFVQGWQQEM